MRRHPRLKQGVIWKHSDRINGGIPDISITLYGVTTWFELKMAQAKPTPLQAYYLKRLRRAYVVTNDGQLSTISDDVRDSYYYDYEELVEGIVERCMR